MKRYDAIVIGAGHNGLVAAAYLARAGLKVCVLERNKKPGGALVNQEIIPNFVAPSGPHKVNLLGSHIMRDLDLVRFGLDLSPFSGHITFLKGGDYIASYPNDRWSQAEIARFSARDAEAFVQYQLALRRQRLLMEPLLNAGAPHPVGGGKDKDRFSKIITGPLRSMGDRVVHEVARFWLGSCADVMDDYFETEHVKAHLAVPAFTGATRSPMSPGSAYYLLHQKLAGDSHGVKGFVRGGMEALIDALKSAFLSSGGELHCDQEVISIVNDRGNAAGVTLKDGTQLGCETIISNLDIKRTFLNLFDWKDLPKPFLRQVSHRRMQGSVAKLNVALDGLPQFTGLPKECPAANGVYYFAQNLMDIERAADAWADGFVPKTPVLEVSIPSLHDQSLAPAGKHVMSIYVQYVPNQLFDGIWDQFQRDALAASVLEQVADYCPGLGNLILGWKLSVPKDLEDKFSLTGGDIHHGEMALDQLLFHRPFPGEDAQGQVVENLYMCGAGAHPGGGVTGQPGWLAARRVLSDLRGAE